MAFKILEKHSKILVSDTNRKTFHSVWSTDICCPSGTVLDRGRGVEGRTKLVTGEGHGRARPAMDFAFQIDA
jgi:hypothetical protein